MDLTKDSFLEILDLEDVPSSEIDNIRSNNDSPLNYFWGTLKTLPEGNQREHSYSVLKRSVKLVRRPGIAVSPSDYLILFYASLAHDISKSETMEVGVHQALIDECKLFSHKNSHGIRSAHYIARKHRDNKVHFYGLEDSNIAQLFNVIAFHETGDMHPCFVSSREISRKELLLCLVFWLADIADAADYRVPATRTVDEQLQTPKTKARLMVKEVSIEGDYIVWWVDKSGEAAQRASNSETKKLSMHRPLLQVFGLPSEIICLKQGMKVSTKQACLQFGDIKASNLCLDVSEKVPPRVLSADTLPDLYEKIVRAFYGIQASNAPSHQNYFGPLVLEVSDVESDEAKRTAIRSQVVKQMSEINRYVERWLDPEKDAEKEFYYGYTHGQRIWGYVFPHHGAELGPNKSFHDWSGALNQFDHVLEILKEGGRDARRSYVVIPHPMIDNPESPFYSPEEVVPSLIAIQFVLEEGNSLSAFALLRSQELSIFFLVNYFEVRELLSRLKDKLVDTIEDIKLGRIVMMTALAYFAPGTPLLEKPRICKMERAEVESLVTKLRLRAGRREFIDLLRDFERDYIKIETVWCENFLTALSGVKGFYKIREGLKVLKETLDSLEEKRGQKGHSATYTREKKREAVGRFIKAVEKRQEHCNDQI